MTEQKIIEEIKKSTCFSENCSDSCIYAENKCTYRKIISALEEIQRYRKIGTVEECREAKEKQKPKKPILHNDNGRLRKACPVCGCFFSPLSRSCPKCGQAILQEN